MSYLTFTLTLLLLVLTTACQAQTTGTPGVLGDPGNPGAEFTLKPITQRPCLLIDPADAPVIAQRWETLRQLAELDPDRKDKVLHALLYGDEALKKKTTADFMASIRAKFDFKPGQRPPSYRRYNEALYRYDLVASLGHLTPQDVQDFRNLMVRGAEYFTGSDPAKFPSPETPLNNGTEFPKGFSLCNRWTDQFMVAALVGLNFPDHPLAHAWVKYAIEQTQYQLDRGNWDTSWCEVPRYHNWTLMLYGGFFKAIHRRTGVDFYQHPHVKPLLDWYLRFSSPLVQFPELLKKAPQGEPTLPAWGDSNYGPLFEVLAMYAPAYATTDPDFSKRLMWMWRRAGCPMTTTELALLVVPQLADPSLPDAPQILGSAFTRKMGHVLLRSGFDTPQETALTLIGGERGITHQRSDLGSIDLFSLGIPLAIGAQGGPYDSPELAWNRAQEANNVVMVGGKSRDRWKSHGKLLAFFTSPQVDYTAADCSPSAGEIGKDTDAFQWRRHIVLAKQPDYVVMWDEITSTQTSQWFLHTTASKHEWDKHRITCRTDYQADLDVHVLAPARELEPNEKLGHMGTWRPDKTFKQDPYPFTQLKYFHIPGQPNEDFITILHPRRPDAPALTARLIESSPQGFTLEVRIGKHIDTVKLTPAGGTYKRDQSPVMDLPLQAKGSTELDGQ